MDVNIIPNALKVFFWLIRQMETLAATCSIALYFNYSPGLFKSTYCIRLEE